MQSRINDIFEGEVNAPEFPANLEWLNTDRPIRLRDLRGKIVLLDFWTFCCINCMHVLPDLKRLERKYADQLVVLGVHSPKFLNERITESIRHAILRYEIEHPVLNDREFEVWQAYTAKAWPTLMLINPRGRVVGAHSGEGIYELFDDVIGKMAAYFREKGELDESPLRFAPERAAASPGALSFPGKVLADEAGGRLFVADSNHNRILVTTFDGAILDTIGTGDIGARDGGFDEAAFHHPQGLALDGDALYVCDTENHLIRRANLAARTVETIAGTGEQARAFNVDGVGTFVSLNSPWDALVWQDKLYIAMAGPHQLWVLDLETLEARPYAGSGRENHIDGPLRQAALAQPSGIATDGRSLFFADSEISSIRSASLQPSGFVRTIVGQGLFDFGDVDGVGEAVRLQHPLGVVYGDDRLYVADTYNHKIKVIDPQASACRTFAGSGARGAADGDPSVAQFNEPGGLSATSTALYVADTNNHRIRRVDLATGEVATIAL